MNPSNTPDVKMDVLARLSQINIPIPWISLFPFLSHLILSHKRNAQMQVSSTLRKNRMNNAVLKKAIIKVIGIAGVAAFSCALQAASFDCAKASTDVEKMICSDSAISQLDSDLGVAYKAAMDKAENKDLLKQEQRLWLKAKLNTCQNVGCLSDVYSQRIAQLNAIQSSSLTTSSISQQPKFTLEKGNQFQLCRDFLDLMNRVPKKEKPNCELDYPFDDIAKKQGFKEIDWKEVNLQDYKEILKNHSVYRSKGLTPDEIKKNEERFEAYFPTSTARVWVASFDANGDEKKDTVVRVKYKNCVEGASGEVFLVRNDGVLDEKAYARRSTGDFFTYQNRTYFYYGFIGEWVGQDTYGYEKTLCSFN
jgi:uncharacterized protein